MATVVERGAHVLVAALGTRVRNVFGTAIRTQRDLLESFGDDLDGVQLTPGDGRVFTVRVDDELVWDRGEHGGDLDLETIREEVGRRAGAPA